MEVSRTMRLEIPTGPYHANPHKVDAGIDSIYLDHEMATSERPVPKICETTSTGRVIFIAPNRSLL